MGNVPLLRRISDQVRISVLADRCSGLEYNDCGRGTPSGISCFQAELTESAWLMPFGVRAASGPQLWEVRRSTDISTFGSRADGSAMIRWYVRDVPVCAELRPVLKSERIIVRLRLGIRIRMEYIHNSMPMCRKSSQQRYDTPLRALRYTSIYKPSNYRLCYWGYRCSLINFATGSQIDRWVQMKNWGHCYCRCWKWLYVCMYISIDRNAEEGMHERLASELNLRSSWANIPVTTEYWVGTNTLVAGILTVPAEYGAW